MTTGLMTIQTTMALHLAFCRLLRSHSFLQTTRSDRHLRASEITAISEMTIEQPGLLWLA